MKKIKIDQKPEECRQSQNTVAELYIENKNLKKRNMETQQRRSEMHTETAVTEKKFTGTALNRKILQKLSGQIWTFWPNRAQKLIEI